MKLPLSKIEEFLNATGECELKEIAQGYSIDSRTVQPGELFFAVKGERLDGHARASGRGRYTVDIRPPGTLETAVLRSPVAHGRVGRLDLLNLGTNDLPEVTT